MGCFSLCLAAVYRQRLHTKNPISAEELACYIRAHIVGIYHQQLSSGDSYFAGLDDIRRSIDLMFVGLQPGK